MTGAKITLVVAMARNGVIGRDGGLPWHISSDLRRFKAITMGKPVIMGRKTWNSLPRKPLPGRLNIILTRDTAFAPPGASRASSITHALELAGNAGEICIIGGADIYRQFLPLATRLDRTLIDRDVAGDTHFPDIRLDDWHLVSDTVHEQGERDSDSFRVQVLEKI